jgi:hypothetical protein
LFGGVNRKDFMLRSPALPIRLLHALLLGAGLLLADAAAAADGGPGWNFSGFGTLGAVHSSERAADFVSSSMKASGAGHTHRWSGDVDSRLGAQVDVRLNERWSAVLQVVSEQHLDNSYRPSVEWANIKYQVTPDVALRLGRIALPMFLAADYRRIGYAFPMVRLPVEVYGALPVPSSDGIDLSWRASTGAVRHTTQAFYGHADVALIKPARFQARQIAGLSHSVDAGAFSARASILTMVLSMNLARPLFAGLDTFGPNGDELVQRYEVDHKRASLASIGVSYDPGTWFAIAEAGRTHSNSFLGKTTMLYAGAGYRHGALTPFLGYATVHADMPTTERGLPLAGLAPQFQLAGASLNEGLNALLKTIPVQSSASAGVRWDLHRDMALTVQYDRVTPRDGSRGTLANTQPGFVSGRAVHVASVALDFVF